MIRSPSSPSSPSLSPSHANARTTSPSTRRSQFSLARSSSSTHRNPFSFVTSGSTPGSAPSSAPTSPTQNGSLPLPPGSPGSSHLRETTFPFSSSTNGSRPSLDHPSPSPSPSLMPSAVLGGRKLERKGTRASSTSGSGRRVGLSASELDGMLDYGSSGSPGPASLMSDSVLGRAPPSTTRLRRKGWYGEYVPKGGFERQWYPWPEGDEGQAPVPYWVSYSQGARNWDALFTSALFLTPNTGTTAFAPSAPPTPNPMNPSPPPQPLSIPRRVLDIGCGVNSLWSIMQASQPGWEGTQFVGLDIAPAELLPANLLPYELATRLSYVQADFLEPLPFDEGQFEFVRIANVGLGVPEHLWAQLIEEATRVMVPGGHLEVVEQNFAVMRRRPRKNSTEDYEKIIDDCFETVLEQRFINPHTIGMIPSQLALNCTNVKSSGITTIPLPARPSVPNSSPSPPPPTSAQHSPLAAYSAGFTTSQPHWPLATISPSLPSVVLQAYAERFASSSCSIATSACTSSSRSSHHHQAPHELESSLHSWSTSLTSHASLSTHLTSTLGWTCAMDEKLTGMLEAHLPVFEEKMRAFDAAYDEAWEAVVGVHQAEGEKWDPEIEYRRAQVAFAKREARVELEKVRRRLGLLAGSRGEEEEQLGSLGELEMGTFVARKPGRMGA